MRLPVELGSVSITLHSVAGLVRMLMARVTRLEDAGAGGGGIEGPSVIGKGLPFGCRRNEALSGTNQNPCGTEKKGSKANILRWINQTGFHIGTGLPIVRNRNDLAG